MIFWQEHCFGSGSCREVSPKELGTLVTGEIMGFWRNPTCALWILELETGFLLTRPSQLKPGRQFSAHCQVSQQSRGMRFSTRKIGRTILTTTSHETASLAVTARKKQYISYPPDRMVASSWRDFLPRADAHHLWNTISANWNLGFTAFGGPSVHFKIVREATSPCLFEAIPI